MGVELVNDAELEAAYQSAGLSRQFIERVLETSSREMWFPSAKELSDEGVVTRWIDTGDDVEPSAAPASAAPSQALPPKLAVARMLLRRGSLYVHLDARRADVVVPSKLRGQARAVLQVGYDMRIPIGDLKVDEAGVSGTLSFDSKPFLCRVPWSAVFALVGDEGKGMTWPESVPPDLEAADREASGLPAHEPVEPGSR
jgi:hypothetical protein